MAVARVSIFKLCFCVLLINITLAAGIDDFWQQFNEHLQNPLAGITQGLQNVTNVWPQVNSTQTVSPTGMEGLATKMQHQTAALNNFMQQLTGMLRKVQGLNPQQERKCADGFKKFNTSCYFFGSVPVNRTKATRSCKQMSSYLAEVDSYAEDHFLIMQLSTLMRKSPVRPGQYLTGGTDRQREGHWVWETTNRPLGYTNWATDEGETKPRNREDYIAYTSRSWPHWADVSDNQLFGFICEYDL